MSAKRQPDAAFRSSSPAAERPHRHRPLHVAGHMLRGSAALVPFAVLTLFMGMAIYHYQEHLPWSDAFLNASMLLGGMGPVDKIESTAGKWMAGGYALFAGLFFIVFAGVMLAPVFHHVLERFHIDDRD
jgi:hypothetical protein